MGGRSTRDAYGDALVRAGADPRVMVLDADLSVSTKTSLFAARYPERFFDCGCAEQNLLGVAAGLALAGKVVFASTYAIFALRAWEQVRNTIAHDGLSVKIAVSHAGLTNGPDGASHQALEDIAVMRAVPGMRVIVPADATETGHVVEHELREKGPVYLRLNRAETPVIFGENYRYRPGEVVVIREGTDVALMATGTMVHRAMAAADLLRAKGIDPTVVNVHTVKPLDAAGVEEAAGRCGAVVTVEEHSCLGGLGSAIAEVLGSRRPVPLRILGVQDRFGESGGYEELLEHHGLTAGHISAAAEAICQERR
jgi:transketolase